MIEEIELRLASGEVLPLGPDALVLGRPNVQDWGAGAWVSKEQVKLSLSAYDSGSVRIESIGQNRTGVYTDKWRWLTKGDVCYVTSDTVLSLHAEKHASAQVNIVGVKRPRTEDVNTWSCTKSNLIAAVQEMRDLADGSRSDFLHVDAEFRDDGCCGVTRTKKEVGR